MALSLALLKPSSHENWPEEFDGCLDCEHYPICCAFNRKGSLLAIGCNDGHIVIWDFTTRILVKTIYAHAGYPICSVDWSRNGQKIVSSSHENCIAVWEAKTGNNLVRWRGPSPIVKAQFNPRNDRMVLVSSANSAPILLEITYPTEENAGLKLIPITIKHKYLKSPCEPRIIDMVASFDRRGQHIYTGNTKGKIVIFKCPTTLDNEMEPDIASSFEIPSRPAITEIQFGAHNKTLFLVNSLDRALRLYDCESALKAGSKDNTCDEIRKIQDSVAKAMWHQCRLSGDPSATYICVGHQNSIHIYETETGSIRKIIPGEKGDQIVDIQLHPLRPAAVSISSGKVSVWVRPNVENWSAFAPEFQELEKNQEYEERESEFDEEDADNYRKEVKEVAIEEPDDLDVDQVEPIEELLSSDEETPEDCLDFIPVSLEDHIVHDPIQPDNTNIPLNESLEPENPGKKHSPQKGCNRRKTGGSLKRPRSGDKFGSAKKSRLQT